MRLGWFTTLSSSVLSLILHLVVGVLLIFSFEFTPQPKSHVRQDVNVVQAVTIDKKQVELELDRIKKIEEEKHKKEKKRLDELEKKAKNLEDKRKKEEKKLAETKKKKEQEQKLRKEEEKKLATLEKEKAELKKQRELEEKKIKEAKDKSDKLKAAEEKKRKDAEAAVKKRLEEELAAELAAEESAEQAEKDQALINNIASNIKRSIESNFNKVGLPDGIACVLRVRLVPGGEVIDVSIAESSGHDIFDRRAVNATQKASPLPVPDDIATFERLDLREINVTFKPTN